MLENNFTNDGGVLQIGGVSTLDLRKKYQTPLYIFDQKLLKDTVRTFLNDFKSDLFETEIAYASKAFSNLYVLGLLNDFGISFDCVSKEEIYLALKAGVSSKKIHFHGNNKTKDEIEFAIKEDIGQIIIDSEDEYYLLDEILKDFDKKIDCLVRINPDVRTDTHKFIQTSNADSKFGLNIRDAKTKDIIKKIIENDNMNLLGFHAHIGSQVKKLDFFKKEAEILLAFTKDMEDEFSYNFSHINLGGGFGTREKLSDEDFDLGKFLKDYTKIIENIVKKLNLSIKSVCIEPGRSLISKAGSILYTVGSKKKTLEGYPLIFVDGGMSDNIRPSLYGAEYSAIAANRLDDNDKSFYRIGGKLCESGDILIEKAKLPNLKRDDLLLIPFAGAYSYAMSSNYNKLRKASVVFVEDGKDYLAVRRQSLEDLISRDLKY